MLAFSNNDEYLVTCGLTRPSAVIIYDWKTQAVLVSTSIMNATQDLFMLPEFSNDGRRMPGDGDPDESEDLGNGGSLAIPGSLNPG